MQNTGLGYNEIESLLGKLPAPSKRLKRLILSKLCADGNWRDREIILTKSKLCILRPEIEVVNDKIYLDEVEEISIFDPNSPESVSISEQDCWAFRLTTSQNGCCSGSKYVIRVHSETEREQWMETLAEAAGKARQARLLYLHNGMRKRRLFVKSILKSERTQRLYAILIIANFTMSVIDSQIFPKSGTAIWNYFQVLEIIFSILFGLELLLNMFVGWFRPFWRDGWNIMDFVVVTGSTISLIAGGVPGGAVLRMIRVFRIFQFFRRLGSLRRIVTTLISAIQPVASALLIIILITCVYAILGTQLYREQTPIYFSAFSVSFFTMFQVATLDAWASEVVITVLSGDDCDTGCSGIVKFFFTSYIIVVSWTLIPVIWAILLDSFLAAGGTSTQSSRDQQAFDSEQVPDAVQIKNPLDATLIFLSHYSSPRDFDDRVDEIFGILDNDDTGKITYAHLLMRLRWLASQKARKKQLLSGNPEHAKPSLSQEEIHKLMHTKHGSFELAMDKSAFHIFIKAELRNFCHVQALKHAMLEKSAQSRSVMSTLHYLKILIALVDVTSLHRSPSAEKLKFWDSGESLRHPDSLTASEEDGSTADLMRKPSKGNFSSRLSAVESHVHAIKQSTGDLKTRVGILSDDLAEVLQMQRATNLTLNRLVKSTSRKKPAPPADMATAQTPPAFPDFAFKNFAAPAAATKAQESARRGGLSAARAAVAQQKAQVKADLVVLGEGNQVHLSPSPFAADPGATAAWISPFLANGSKEKKVF